MKAIMATADGGAGAVWVLKPGCDVLESPWLKPQWPSAPGTKDRSANRPMIHRPGIVALET
ncbi:MAG: hypothetical protein E6K18_05455 [Methanobacteriota archaeon]|nr:MAG: hypothetical protein E6K18_05455 [Euryarchaeota archaeon]